MELDADSMEVVGVPIYVPLVDPGGRGRLRVFIQVFIHLSKPNSNSLQTTSDGLLPNSLIHLSGKPDHHKIIQTRDDDRHLSVRS